MRELVPGHRYALRNLKTSGETEIQFFQDPALHDRGVCGPSTQEYLRAVIARIKYLDMEKPWEGNAQLVQHARQMIALFEVRALLQKVEKGELDIETLPVGDDGHLIFCEDSSK